MHDPVDGEPVRGIDFNRIILEVNAIEATLGTNPQGNMADLGTRLYQDTDPNTGMQKGGVICEDDPASANRGTRRWFYNNKFAATTDTSGEMGFGYPYNIFDAGDPVAVATQMVGVTADNTTMSNRFSPVIMTNSQNMIYFKCYKGWTDDLSASLSITMLVITVGVLEVFEDEAPYMWRADNLG